MSDKHPSQSLALSQFLDKASQLPARQNNQTRQQGRLLFAMDATASRQPQWDKACHLQSQMFSATNTLGGLQVQLCYYRGYREFYTSPWFNNSQALLNVMNQVRCLGGHTQIGRVINHCLSAHRQQAIQAAIVVADALEEPIDQLCDMAGQLGMLNLPLLMIQEGADPAVERAFKQLATLSKGAYAKLNEHSADSLADFLAAAATFASGGQQALKRLESPAAKQLLAQLGQR